MTNQERSLELFTDQYRYDPDARQCSNIAGGIEYWRLMFNRGYKTPFDADFIQAQQVQQTSPVDNTK